MGNNSSKKSNTEFDIQDIRKPKLTKTKTQTQFHIIDEVDEIDDADEHDDVEDVDDHPAPIRSPIQMPQTPLAESIAYHLTRLRSANKLTDHSSMQTPSILLRRRIAKDLGLSLLPARDMNSPMDPRSPNGIIPRTPMSLYDRGKAKSMLTMKPARNVNRKLSIDDESGQENRRFCRRDLSGGEMKATQQSSENEVTSTVDDSVTNNGDELANEKCEKKDVPDSVGRRAKIRKAQTTPNLANIRPRIDTRRRPLSVISQPGEMDKKTPIRTEFTTPRPKSVSRIPVYRR